MLNSPPSLASKALAQPPYLIPAAYTRRSVTMPSFRKAGPSAASLLHGSIPGFVSFFAEDLFIIDSNSSTGAISQSSILPASRAAQSKYVSWEPVQKQSVPSLPIFPLLCDIFRRRAVSPWNKVVLWIRQLFV